MIPIEKYAQAAASTARTPPNSPARRAAIDLENAARVAAEQFVKGLEAERDELRVALQGLDDAYCRAGTPLTRDERTEDRKRLIAARAAIAKATGAQA